MLSLVECDEVNDGKGNKTSMKGVAIKASMSEMVSLEGGEKKVHAKIFSAEGCKKEVSVVKVVVGSEGDFGGKVQERRLVLCRVRGWAVRI